MEITDEIKKDGIMTREEQEDIFFTLLNGKTVKEEIETSRGKFVIKFPKHKDMLYIRRRVTAMRGGLPVASFDDYTNFSMYKIAFLDAVVESGDTWYENIKNKNKNFSWEDMPDADFVDEVYVKAWDFRTEVQKKLGRNEDKTDSGSAVEKNVPEVMDDGLFSGVAYSGK